MTSSPEIHKAVRAAIVRLATDDPGAFPALTGDLLEDIAYAIAQRLVRNLSEDGWVISRKPSGRGRVTNECLDQRLAKSRRRKAAMSESPR